MHGPNAIVALSERVVAEDLVASLQGHFQFIYQARSFEEVRAAMLKYRPHVLIVDVELAPLSAIERLRREYKGVSVICTHRLANEDLWLEALSVGATDLYELHDVAGMVRAALGQGAARAMAA
jgi:chemotaxis response regulator CheB